MRGIEFETTGATNELTDYKVVTGHLRRCLRYHEVQKQKKGGEIVS